MQNLPPRTEAVLVGWGGKNEPGTRMEEDGWIMKSSLQLVEMRKRGNHPGMLAQLLDTCSQEVVLTSGPDHTHRLGSPSPLPSALLVLECSTGESTGCEVLILYGWVFFLCSLVAEIGDFDEASDREHLAKNKYIPQQDALEDKIVEFHHNHM